jgi:tetratricopeptide (TPR) repeat protein
VLSYTRLENYGSVLRDCSRALGLNPKSSKAFYRSALALLALERMEEALDCCDRCLAFDSNNAGVKTVKERVVKAKEIKDKKEKAKEERLRQEAEAKHQMNLAFRVSGNMRIVKHTFLIGIRP